MRPDLAGTDGFVRACWYVAGRSEDFGRTPVPVTLLGERVVIFNTGAAQKYVEVMGTEPLPSLPDPVDWEAFATAAS